ncbi:MAG TPA: HdeD family acid-resistance protein [Solirubrobacteraceae bacterium]|nr:HdeD family acid-resistance protein [Solirubrobacteraceae bacterium]
MDDVAQIAKEWWMFAVLGVVSLVCGVLAIVYPDVTLLAVGIIFGFYLLMAGVFELVEAIVGDPASRALSAIVGIVSLIAGLICLRRPGDSLLAIVVVLGAYLIVSGVARLVRAFASVEHRGWALLTAVVDLILGILILSWPDESLVTLAVLFGISLIFRGVFSLVAAFQLRKLRKGGSSDMAPPITATPA